YNLNINWNAANRVVDCYSGVNNSIDDAVEEVINQTCPPGMAPNGLFGVGAGCDAIPQIQPSTPAQNYVPVNANLTCANDEGFVGLDFNPTTQKYEKRCLRVYNFDTASCAPDQLLRRRSNGQFDCVRPRCPSTNQIF